MCASGMSPHVRSQIGLGNWTIQQANNKRTRRNKNPIAPGKIDENWMFVREIARNYGHHNLLKLKNANGIPFCSGWKTSKVLTQGRPKGSTCLLPRFEAAAHPGTLSWNKMLCMKISKPQRARRRILQLECQLCPRPVPSRLRVTIWVLVRAGDRHLRPRD